MVTDDYKELVHRQRRLLQRLQQQMRELGASDSDRDIISETTLHLDELFLLCLVGEFNSGKSSLVNALLGGRHVKEGVTPTTDRVCLIKHADSSSASSAVSADVSAQGHPAPLIVELPVPWLRDVTLVDTPGTNAIIEGHAEITNAIIPRCDLVLFITSAERPMSESERAFMARIHEWGKKVVVVVNKADLLSPGTLYMRASRM